jgi:uncharacterized protein YutE (UPF0331/DUF86 family)
LRQTRVPARRWKDSCICFVTALFRCTSALEITATEAELLHKITGLRNVLSHDYEKLNLEILKNIVDEKLGEIESLLALFSKK